ncbi:MAG: hypothetical protein IH863_04620 [Chloroflexi bacterium]|nr:hypothetical protein [Chloroflexota bacterium]
MKKLSEILEECIEAGIAGRRGLEESLALYPAQAEELEPLLRTALSVSDSFQSYTPPAAVEQRVRSRFLADAAARRNLRHLEGSFEKRGWLTGLFRKPVLGGFAAAAAVAVAVVAVTVGGVDLGGSENDGIAVINPVSPTAVSALGNRVDSINEIIDGGGQIQTSDVAEISALLAQLTAASPEELRASAAELEATLPGTLALLESGSGIIPDDPAVLDAITATRDIAAAIDLDLPGPIDVVDATPTDPPIEPTDAPVEPTPAPSGGSATAAPTATPPPPPQPTPTTTADDRAPPGFPP